MYKIIVFVMTLAALIYSCSEHSEKTEVKEIDPRLIYGQWRNVYMKLHMNTYRNSDSAFTLEVNEDNWAQIMNIKPIRTFFWSDHTYNSMHINLQDSLVYNPSGHWRLLHDSLFMRDTFPEKRPEFRYKVKLHDRVMEFTGIEDLDADGKADDDYYGTQRQVGTHR
jgi:hypothetical protein